MAPAYDTCWSVYELLTSEEHLMTIFLCYMGERQKVRQKAVRWPCGCSKGVDCNSLQCTSCQKWVHKKCSGIKGSMSKVAKSFICSGCLKPVTSAGRTSVDIGASAKLELVDKFCYLGDVAYIQNDHKPKRPQTKATTKRYQNHIHLANEKSFGHQFFLITD